MQASFKKYILKFKIPSGTSRGILSEKESWFLIIKDGEKTGVGECSIIRGLSIDLVSDFEQKLKWVCQNIHLEQEELFKQIEAYPSIKFGLEMALRSLSCPNPYILFPSDFTEGKDQIDINGLVWMGNKDFMLSQCHEKVKKGFRHIKFKIGALNFDEELAILKSIREKYSSKDISVRVDANGAFNSNDVLDKLVRLAKFDIHSIEQPIATNQWDEMEKLCINSPIPIALDEELIGVEKREMLLDKIKPQYIILKPSLLGGFSESQKWIEEANKRKIGWWVTSALESNIGLNALCQWTYTLKSKLPQGLGTGQIYTNNFKDCPLAINNGKISYNPEKSKLFNLYI